MPKLPRGMQKIVQLARVDEGKIGDGESGDVREGKGDEEGMGRRNSFEWPEDVF